MRDNNEFFTRAIRAGCEAAEVRLICTYPDCDCSAIPKAVRAALQMPGEHGEYCSKGPDDARRAVEIYNEAAALVGWPKASRMTPPRERAILKRLIEYGYLDGWRQAMQRATKSSFLSGRSQRGNSHATWQPNLDFFLQPSSFTKLIEGGFDDPVAKRAPSAGFNL